MKEHNKRDKFKILKIISLIIISTGLCIVYARYLGIRGLVIKEYKITSTNLDDNYDSFKIVHFSDLHYGTTIKQSELNNIVLNINNQKPDVIVFTGDLVDKEVKLSKKQYNNMITELKKLDPKIEVISVIGNHDYKNDYYKKVIEELEWHHLDNTYEFVYNNSKKPIVFVGLDDALKGNVDIPNAFSYINEIQEDNYTIVLTHEPDLVNEFKNNYDFDLVLAGHSHLGQVRVPGFGAIITPDGAKKYYDEHYKVNNADMYISGGLGTSGLKLRFLNKPSINLYRFYTK